MHTVPKPLPLSLTLLIVFALLLGSALMVKPVSAASIVVNSAEDIIADDGVCTLREAITAANTDAAFYGCAAGNGADTIIFAGNYTITLELGRLDKILSSITITGHGAENTIIQASECNPVTQEPAGCTPASYNVFEVANSGILSLDGVAVRHGNTHSGGAILNEGTLNITNCTIAANKAIAYGSGIFNGGIDAVITITNSLFSDNETSGAGGGISNYNGSVFVTGSTFLDNVALEGGGIHNLSGTTTVIDSSFFNNMTLDNGGGLYNDDTLSVTNSTISGNTANDGGGICNRNDANLTITNSTISGNNAHNGGGIDNEGTLSVTSSTISGNNANDGGGIFNPNNANLTITNSTINNNAALRWGGGIHSRGNLEIINGTLSGNTAGWLGGAIDNWGGQLVVRNSTLYGNTTDFLGGGINNEGTMNIANTIIAASMNGDCNNSGTMHLDSTHNLIEDGGCQVADGSNISDDPLLGPLADNGGLTLTHALQGGSPAIDAGSGALCPDFDQRGIPRPQGAACDIGAFEVEHRVVYNNDNEGAGSLRQVIDDISPGGIITFSPSLSGQTITLFSPLLIDKNMTVDGSGLALPITISGNNAVGVFNVGSSVDDATLSNLMIIRGNRGAGGGIFNMGTLMVTNCTVSDNYAQEDGGGIYNQGKLTIINSTLSGNNAQLDGGGIYNTPDTILSVHGSTLSGNISQGNGGGINNMSFLTMENSTLSSNNCDGNGGGIFNHFGTVTITSSNFSDNTAYDGGAIYTNWNLSIISGTISGNQASFKGGGVFNNGNLEVDQSTFLANDAVLGGGIRNDEGSMSKITVTDSIFHENTAAHGGAIDNWGDGPNLINTSSLIENSATASGGGIRNWSTLTVKNSSISGNSAISVNDGEGGGIRNEGILVLENMIINGNTAHYFGGGIYNYFNLQITNSTLSENSAYDGGGIYNLFNLQITNSTLFGNTASEDAGGVLNVGTLNMTNSTLSGNGAKYGGGILNDGPLNLLHVTLYENIAEPGKGGGIINYPHNTIKLINTLVAGSTGGDCVNNGTMHLDSTHNLVEDGSCGALLDDDPMLGPLADNGGPTWTHALLPGSPAIDAGSGDHCQAFDQRGYDRPIDGNGDGVAGCDIGAFEWDGENKIFLPLILR